MFAWIRLTLLATIAAFLLLPTVVVDASPHHGRRSTKNSKFVSRIKSEKFVNKVGAGIFRNAALTATIRSTSDRLTGAYYIQNVATGAFLWWSHEPTQTIMPSTTDKMPMILSNFGLGTQVKPQASNGKCLAAQFNMTLGVDFAGTMYHCANTRTVSHDIGDAQAKQQWHFLAVDGRDSTYYLIPEDHLANMQTRALSSETLITAGDYTSTAIALHDETDTNQMWLVTPA